MRWSQGAHRPLLLLLCISHDVFDLMSIFIASDTGFPFMVATWKFFWKYFLKMGVDLEKSTKSLEVICRYGKTFVAGIRKWLRVNSLIKRCSRDLGQHPCVPYVWCAPNLCWYLVQTGQSKGPLLGFCLFPQNDFWSWVFIINSLPNHLKEVFTCDAKWRRKKMKNDEKWQSHNWLSCPTVHLTKCFLSVLSQSPQWPRQVSAVSVFILWMRKLKLKERTCPRSHSLASPSGRWCHWGTVHNSTAHMCNSLPIL